MRLFFAGWRAISRRNLYFGITGLLLLGLAAGMTVRACQSALGLPVTGVVDKELSQLLGVDK